MDARVESELFYLNNNIRFKFGDNVKFRVVESSGYFQFVINKDGERWKSLYSGESVDDLVVAMGAVYNFIQILKNKTDGE